MNAEHLPVVALGPDSTDRLTEKDKEFCDDLEFVNRHASQFAKLVRLLRVWNKAREEYMNADRKVIGAAAEDRLADINADARMDVERFVFGSMTMIGDKRKPNLADMVGGWEVTEPLDPRTTTISPREVIENLLHDYERMTACKTACEGMDDPVAEVEQLRNDAKSLQRYIRMYTTLRDWCVKHGMKFDLDYRGDYARFDGAVIAMARMEGHPL